MPSTSAKQAKFMRAVAHSPKFAKKVGVPQSVGKDYEMADKKMRKFASAGKVGRGVQENVNKALENISASTPKPDMKADGAELKAAVAPQKAPTFAEAFRAARKDPEAMKRGSFTWGGKTYTTKMAGEGAKRPAASSSTAKPTEAKPTASGTNTRAQMEMRRTATRSQAAIREKRAENQADFRKRMQGKTATAPKVEAKRDNTAAGRRERMGKFFSSLNPYNQADAKGKAGRPLILTGEAARKANKGTIGGKAKGGKIDGCAIRGKTRAPMRKGK